MIINVERLVSNLIIWLYEKVLKKKSFPFNTSFSKPFWSERKCVSEQASLKWKTKF